MKKTIAVISIMLVCMYAQAARVSNFTEVSLDSLHGNWDFNVVNPADELYYPVVTHIDGSSISDDGIIRNAQVYYYLGTPQAKKFETAIEVYQASPALIKLWLKDLGLELIDVDLSN